MPAEDSGKPSALGRFLGSLFLGLSLPACAVFAGCGVQHEQEPNDHFTEANPVRPNSRVRGRIENPKDVDMFKLDVKQDKAVLSLHVGGIRDVDFVLSVLDQDRLELKRYDETGVGGDEEATDLGVHRGIYYIVLSNKNEKANNPAQEYELSIKLEPADGRELEPNDKMMYAQALPLGGVLRGHYFPTQNLLSDDPDHLEEDWYKIAVDTGLYVLNLDISEVPKVQPVLEIYDANAYKLKEAGAEDAGMGIGLKNLGLKGPAQYFLRLYPRQKRTGNPDVFYEILPQLIPWRGETEFEPNDQRLEATPFDRDAVTGTINPKGDVDWYRIAVATTSKQIFSASLSAVPDMDLQMDFADELGNPLVHVDNAGKEQPEVLTGIGVTQGTYYLVISEKTGKLADARHPYTLTRSLVPWQPGLEYELNDSTRTAQSLKVGESVDGYIAPKGDVDWYVFNVYQKGRLIVEATGVLNVQLSLTLLDQEYKELLRQTGKKPGDSATLVRDADPGTYYVRLQGTDPNQNNIRDKYTLRLRAQ